MQKRLLKVSIDSVGVAINALEALKSADIKSRKAARVSAKPKWTKRIDATTASVNILRLVKTRLRQLPKRVA